MLDRISALLERAGCPTVIELYTVQPTQQKPNIHETLEDCIEAIVRDRTLPHTATIEALADALEKVLNERDQLHHDLRQVVTKHNSCECCIHDPYHSLDCYKCMTENRWAWRGVPDKEEAHV